MPLGIVPSGFAFFPKLLQQPQKQKTPVVALRYVGTGFNSPRCPFVVLCEGKRSVKALNGEKFYRW